MALPTPAEVQELETRKAFLEESLTPKQVQFCYEYLIDFNATQAAIRAGYSEHTAQAIGWENLNKPFISELLSILREERKARAQKTGDDIIEELENIGFSRLNRVIRFRGDNVKLRDSDHLEDKDAAAIESVAISQMQIGDAKDDRTVIKTKVKLYPKTPALTLLAKHHKVCTDKHAAIDSIDLPNGVTINFVSAEGDEE